MPNNTIQDYIGDGVYVEFDGYGIWLRANSPDSPKEVYLEPEVLMALNRFYQNCKAMVCKAATAGTELERGR